MIKPKIDREKILIEEIKVIQDVIKRMASNSFSVKTWTITLVVATLLFRGNADNIVIAFIPLFSFWFLDSYYLKQERLFREVYKWVIKYRLKNDSNIFNINPMRFKDDVQSTFRIMFSISILPFYGGIFIMLNIYIFIIHNNLLNIFYRFMKECLGA
jgi:hypothetical protein